MVTEVPYPPLKLTSWTAVTCDCVDKDRCPHFNGYVTVEEARFWFYTKTVVKYGRDTRMRMWKFDDGTRLACWARSTHDQRKTYSWGNSPFAGTKVV